MIFHPTSSDVKFSNLIMRGRKTPAALVPPHFQGSQQKTVQKDS